MLTDSGWAPLRKFLETVSLPAGILFALSSALTFLADSRTASYVFLAAAYLFLSAAIAARPVGKTPNRETLVGAITVLVLAWVAFQVAEDYRQSQGKVVLLARGGEILVLWAEFDDRGEAGGSAAVILGDRLQQEIRSAGVRNVRLEKVSRTRRVVDDRVAARAIAREHGAVLVVWGRYESGQTHANVAVVQNAGAEDALPHRDGVSAVPSLDTSLVIPDGATGDVAFFSSFVAGLLLLHQQRPGEARLVFDLAEGYAAPSQPSAGIAALYFYRAVALGQAGVDLSLVIDDYTRAVNAEPALATAYYLRAAARAERGDAAALSFADYLRATDLDRSLIPAVYVREQDLPVEFRSSRAFASAAEAMGLAALGDYDRALDRLAEATAVDEGFLPAYYLRGRVHHLRGEYEPAIADYTRFLAVRGAGGQATEPVYYAVYARALARRSLGLKSLAREDCEAFLAASPRDESLRAYTELLIQELR